MKNRIAGSFLCLLIFGFSGGGVEAGPKGYGESSGAVPTIAQDYFFGPKEVPECEKTEDPLEQVGILRKYLNDPEEFKARGRGQAFEDKNGRWMSISSVSRLHGNLTLKNLEDVEAVLPFILDPDPKIRLLVGSACQRYPGYDRWLYGMGFWVVLTRDEPEKHQAIIDSFTEFIAKERKE